MNAVMIYTCSNPECGGTSPPSEVEPRSWKRYADADGERLLCSLCSMLRETQPASNPKMNDAAFVAGLGLVRSAHQKPTPQSICRGCREPFPAARGGDYCPTCTAIRRTPRHYSQAERRNAGIDPATVFSDNPEVETTPAEPHPEMIKRQARDDARAAAWLKSQQ